MKAFTNVFTYIPFIYFVFVSFYISFANHIWYHKYRPYTDLTVFVVNSFVYYLKNYVINNMLVYHIWQSVIVATYALCFNSIYTAMFEDFMIESVLENIILSLTYTVLIWVCHYVILSTKAMIIVHVFFMYLPLDRNWVINLVAFVSFVVFYIITQFSDVIEYKISDKKLSLKPLLVSYMYLCINEMTIPMVMIHAVLEYYLGKEIKLVEVETDILDVVDKAYDNALKKIKRVRFSDEVKVSDEELGQFVDQS